MNAELTNSISKMIVNGSRLELPKNKQFSNYPAVKKCLIDAGGKYKNCGFVFSEDAQSMKNRLLEGEAINDKKKFQFFATPEPLVKVLIDLADITDNCKILEPSAGQGAIAKYLPARSVLVELMEQNITALKSQGFSVNEGDFLRFSIHDLGVFNKIVANPPFSKNQDIDHIKHMYSFLYPGGRLVSFASKSWLTGVHKKQTDFRDWVERVDGRVISIEKGAFKSSGTNIETVIVVIDKPA